MKQLRRSIGEFLGLLIYAIIGVGLVGAEIAFAYAAWPTKWEAAAQATLAAALITLAGVFLTTFAKFAFDNISLRTSHTLAVRQQMLERFYDYAADYLLPLASAAAELARYMEEYGTAVTDARRSQSMDGAFFSVALYVRSHCTLVGTHRLPNRDAPLGLLLRSRDAERRVWNLVVPPWALGISTLEAESQLVAQLYGGDGKACSPHLFVVRSREVESGLNTLRAEVERTIMERRDYARDLIVALRALNAVMNIELSEVYSVWYTDHEVDAGSALDDVMKLPEESKRGLGIYYLPSRQKRD